MNQLLVDITDIEREIVKVKERKQLEEDTFNSIVRRKKSIWNAYFLDSLMKEKKAFEYANQKVNEDFEKLYSIIKSLQDEIIMMNESHKRSRTPMSFNKLKEWTKEEDVLADLFVVSVNVSDIKKLIKESKTDALVKKNDKGGEE